MRPYEPSLASTAWVQAQVISAPYNVSRRSTELVLVPMPISFAWSPSCPKRTHRQNFCSICFLVLSQRHTYSAISRPTQPCVNLRRQRSNLHAYRLRPSASRSSELHKPSNAECFFHGIESLRFASKAIRPQPPGFYAGPFNRMSRTL